MLRGKDIFWVTLLLMFLTACGSAYASNSLNVETPTPQINTTSIESTPLPGNLDQISFIEDSQEYTIRQLLPRDGILPIYEPLFVPAATSNYDLRELVMGVAINGDARAYAIGILRRRELVNDVVGGTPVLVSW